jgi:hypothetical protein
MPARLEILQAFAVVGRSFAAFHIAAYRRRCFEFGDRHAPHRSTSCECYHLLCLEYGQPDIHADSRSVTGIRSLVPGEHQRFAIEDVKKETQWPLDFSHSRYRQPSS